MDHYPAVVVVAEQTGKPPKFFRRCAHANMTGKADLWVAQVEKEYFSADMMALQNGMPIEVDGIPVVFFAGELQPEDFYVTVDAEDRLHLFIAETIVDGYVYSAGRAHLHYLAECVRVREYVEE